MLCALHSTGWALQFASAELRADRDAVQAAVNRDGGGLRFATPELQTDRELALLSKRRRYV